MSPPRRILLATLGAFGAATAATVAFVLPAELGVDPTGIGRALGLTGLAEPPSRTVRQASAPLVVDGRRFELAPFESVEFKYRLAAGDGLVYAWAATGEVVFDLHAEPADAPPGVASSFAQGRGVQDRGTYVAAFAGAHGWFWENRGFETVAVALQVAGFPTAATHYYDGRAEAAELPARTAPPAASGSADDARRIAP